MGIPVELFNAKPDDHFLCGICQFDVHEDPYSLKCGHSFCKACVDSTRGSSCPVCNATGAVLAAAPNHSLRGLIGNLVIKCKNDSSNEDNGEEPESTGCPVKRR